METVEAVLRRYFEAGFTHAEGGSHQLRVSHPALFLHPHFVGGTLSIPVKGGQTVKPFYLKRIVEAIEIIQQAEAPLPETDPETEQDHDTDEETDPGDDPD